MEEKLPTLLGKFGICPTLQSQHLETAKYGVSIPPPPTVLATSLVNVGSQTLLIGTVLFLF